MHFSDKRKKNFIITTVRINIVPENKVVSDRFKDIKFKYDNQIMPHIQFL